MLLECKLQHDLNHFNRPVRTRMPGGVAGEQPKGCPLCRLRPAWAAVLEVKVLSRADHSERSEAQLHEGDRVWEGSVERIRESRYTKRI